MMKFHLPKEAEEILAILKKAHFQAYIVGGCVRDLLLGRETNDWDFTTDATPEQIIKLFPDSFYDNKFGTVGVPIKQLSSVIYEITTFRSEFGYTDHRHPDKIIWGKTLEEDLQRRDFTINALAYDGKTLTDLYEGQQDLKNQIIRAVGEADTRFKEDALRMMRAVRIATELQFIIEEKTFSAIRNNNNLLTKISNERIRDELIKILASPFPADGIKLLRNGTLLSVILPELEKCFGVEQRSPKRHHMHDVGTHLLKSLELCPSKDPIVRLATLLHDIGKPITVNTTADGIITFYNHEIISASIVRNIAERLHFSKKDRDKLIKLVRFHQFTVDEKQTDSALRRFIRNVGTENLQDMLDLRVGDRLGGGARETSWRLELFKKRLEEVQKQPFTVSDLKVDGHDVMKIYNIGPGPLIGAILDMLFNDVVEGKLKNEREILLKRIKDLKKESKVN
ncbi:CCA tRNA nucleotidyltransferase [Candidatus Gottesmanbacteria bacterium]|nr:CCA tRNA nucleotidyltransferase [Candidatus Gottesmanbacteria bacterium]